MIPSWVPINNSTHYLFKNYNELENTLVINTLLFNPDWISVARYLVLPKNGSPFQYKKYISTIGSVYSQYIMNIKTTTLTFSTTILRK